MNIELGILQDGTVLLVCDNPLPALVVNVVYFSEQRLLMFVYDSSSGFEDELMEYEIPESMAFSIEKSSSIIIYTLFQNHEPIGYKTLLTIA